MMSHTHGVVTLQLTTTYNEQQATSTTVDVMFFRKWHEYAWKKAIEEKEIQNKEQSTTTTARDSRCPARYSAMLLSQPPMYARADAILRATRPLITSGTDAVPADLKGLTVLLSN
ncbi:hypothetical protein J6590_021715 [Homalodisca vitripennis]|nr:hypothetical protein J6590_021715 [Homalodisca vitripennis]